MIRLCGGCNRGAPYVGEYNYQTQCRECWNYANDPAYRHMFDNAQNSIVQNVLYSGLVSGFPEPRVIWQSGYISSGIAVDPPKPIQEAPGWFQKAVNFSKAAVTHVWNGLPETPSEEVTKRIELCMACELIDLATGVCTHKSCGCKVARKAKWLDQVCPLSKW